MQSEKLGILREKNLIFALSLITIFCLLYIIRLKLQLKNEIQKRLYPQLDFELIHNPENNDYGFSIENSSPFTVKNIILQDLGAVLTDFGFEKKVLLRFKPIELIKPKEKLRLKYEVFDREETLLSNIGENIIIHLVNTPLKISVNYSTMQDRTLHASYHKKADKFYLEKIEGRK
ncbi:MAG: hypothetical protein COV72_07265 [Candidatus Omnitrophica bacterium CG11_big_fil_rev_8_21_14_0_20_42_13]|uniref:Uncharacterized protein n=1 Tax=Candidatus Ghiorseimicrobium undicola TaxID=1974746 RepID=A0A2H0LYS9_9BACT|nr:MAG: hypothetical protein COV72_07265 [Candidatus Omnitrophica bacterium CG11_big_fil_rev_8_21_14_0_20_42_13]